MMHEVDLIIVDGAGSGHWGVSHSRGFVVIEAGRLVIDTRGLVISTRLNSGDEGAGGRCGGWDWSWGCRRHPRC